ncbi:MAG TPA: response regulator [Vicinamibacterales bacterium]|nr:response regulator [Vicinamibacterales bacterium]
MTSPRPYTRIVVFLAGLALMGLVAVVSVRETCQYERTTEWMVHAKNVLAALSDARASIDTAETAARGYLLSGDPVRLARYQRARADIVRGLDGLGALVSGDSQQTARLSHLRTNLAAECADLDRLIAVRHASGRDAAARAFADRGTGGESLQAGQAIEAMATAENRELDGRERRWRQQNVRVLATLGTLVTLGMALLGGVFFGLDRQARARARADAALRAGEARMRLIIDHMLSGLVITNEQGIIQSVNPAAERIFGRPALDLVGQHVTVLHEKTDGDATVFLEALRRRSLGTVTEWSGRKGDGTLFPVELALFEFEDGGRRHFAGLMSDVSERRRIEQMKDEFVSIVSHELRTPLTSIRGSLQLVIDEAAGQLDREQGQLLNVALGNCERLIRIINDILDVSKIEAGGLQLRREACAAHELVASAIHGVEGIARARHVRIVPYVDPGLPLVSADSDRIVQALVNLVSNAVKFAPDESVVTIEASKVGGMVSFAVHDCGKGIAPGDLPRLFHKFSQLDGSATRKVGGTGLGLVITKAIVEQHGGTVEASSEPGFGTTFTMTVPMVDGVRRGPVTPAPDPALPSGYSRRRVLVVDDDDDMRLVLRRQLEGAGYEVAEARDGSDAVEQARARKPDLVVMDLIMPRASGYAAVKEMTGDLELSGIPIIVLSVIADELRDAMKSVIVLQKPMTADALLREVAGVIGGGGKPKVLIAEDDSAVRQLYVMLIRRQGFDATAVEDGRVALRQFEQEGADLILADLNMPGLDGLELIRRVRGLPGGDRVPIIAMSGQEPQRAEAAARRAGADLFLAKPMSVTECVQQIAELLDGRTLQADRRAS